VYQNVVKTYIEIAQSRLVAEKTIQRLCSNIKPDTFLDNIYVSAQEDTQIIVIQTKGEDPAEARDTVNYLAESFIEECQNLLPTGSVKVVDKAYLPEKPILPNHKNYIIIGFIMGVMLSLVVIFLINYLDNTIKTEDELERYIGIPVLGVIPRENKNKKH
jgi:capsular polysaccharide biosynthesis protein